MARSRDPPTRHARDKPGHDDAGKIARALSREAAPIQAENAATIDSYLSHWEVGA
jgi:hypothetical protein